MAEEKVEAPKTPETPEAGRSKADVALELMKFIAVQTGYGKGVSSGAGFSGKPAAISAEEHTNALLRLYERCRDTVGR